MTHAPDRRPDLHAVSAAPEHDARGLAWLAVTLGVAATALGVVLVAAGEAFPPAGAMVVFAFLAWFAVNRYTFFPSELAVTAESAVLMAAVIVFRDDAPLLGPWCVALLVGPLDAVHWEHRAFSRMGFNAAHQMLAVVAASVAYAVVAAHGDDAVVEGVAVAAAVATYAAVVWIAGVAVLCVWSRLAVAPAVGRLLALDWIVVPLAVLGAAAGFGASSREWWVLPLVLVPAAMLPDFLLARGRSFGTAFAASRRVRAVACTTAGALLLAPVAAAVGPTALVVLGVLVLACLAAAELQVRQRALVPPLGGVVVAVAAAAAAGFGVSWASPARTLSALVAGLLAAVAAALGAPGGARRFELARVGWAVPVFAVGITGALAVPRFGAWGIAVALVLVVATAVLLVGWASPPWSSALLVPTLAPARGAFRRRTLAALVLVGGVGAAVAGDAHTAALRAASTLVAVASIEVALAAAAVGARQWRFDPRQRRLAAVVVVVTAVVVVAALPAFAVHVPEWLALVTVVAGVIALLVGDTPARLGDVAQRAEPDGDELPTRRG